MTDEMMALRAAQAISAMQMTKGGVLPAGASLPVISIYPEALRGAGPSRRRRAIRSGGAPGCR